MAKTNNLIDGQTFVQLSIKGRNTRKGSKIIVWVEYKKVNKEVKIDVFIHA